MAVVKFNCALVAAAGYRLKILPCYCRLGGNHYCPKAPGSRPQSNTIPLKRESISTSLDVWEEGHVVCVGFLCWFFFLLWVGSFVVFFLLFHYRWTGTIGVHETLRSSLRRNRVISLL